MTRERWMTLFRYGFAALGLIGLIEEYFYNVANRPSYAPANLFSFFTVQASIIVVVALVISGFCVWRGMRPRWVQ